MPKERTNRSHSAGDVGSDDDDTALKLRSGKIVYHTSLGAIRAHIREGQVNARRIKNQDSLRILSPLKTGASSLSDMASQQ
jgi:hypothetical protein